MLTRLKTSALSAAVLLRRNWEKFQDIDFSSIAHPEDVGFDPKVVYRSMPSGGLDLYRVLKTLNFSDQDRILDIGCGKGSAMRTMLRFPFQAVHGIEISDIIARAAERNFQRIKAERAHIFIEDATLFSHYADYNIFYLFNPFPAAIMQSVLHRLVETAPQRTSRTVIIYNNPKCHDLIIDSGFVLECEFWTFDGIAINVYALP